MVVVSFCQMVGGVHLLIMASTETGEGTADGTGDRLGRASARQQRQKDQVRG
jgi:hypothetical protein